MIVQFEKGKAKLSLWSFLTALISIIIAAGSIAIAANAYASSADHRTISASISAEERRIEKVEALGPRVERLEQADAGQVSKIDMILEMLKDIRRRLP